MFRGYLRGVSLGLFRVGLGFLWVKFQILDCLKGLLKAVLVFWGVGVGFII